MQHLEYYALLALHPPGVQAVEHVEAQLDAALLHDPHGVVEAALDLDNLGAVGQRLSQLAVGYLAFRYEHHRLEPRLGGVSRHGGAGVACGGAYNHAGSVSHRLRDCDGHTPVLEAACGVLPLVFQLDTLQPGVPGHLDTPIQVGVALRTGDYVFGSDERVDELLVPPDAATVRAFHLAEPALEDLQRRLQRLVDDLKGSPTAAGKTVEGVDVSAASHATIHVYITLAPRLLGTVWYTLVLMVLNASTMALAISSTRSPTAKTEGPPPEMLHP